MISWKKLISPPGKSPRDIKEWLGLVTDNIKKLKGSENWYDDVSLLTSNSIINNLESGGSDKALSSEQGKILNQKVIEIKSRLDAILNDNNISVGAGREIELQVGNGYVQWRYKGDMEWNNLISITELQVPGPQGPQGIPGKDGATPDMTEFKQNITKQYQDIEAKINKIEQSDTTVTTPINGNILTLTTNKRQKTTMVNNTTIKLPEVNKFTEIQLTFNTTEALTIILPSIKWQSNISIEANKRYVFIFTYDDEWTGGVISYNA